MPIYIIDMFCLKKLWFCGFLCFAAVAFHSKELLAESQSQVKNSRLSLSSSLLSERNPKAMGLILAFKSWPLKEAESASLLKKLGQSGLQKWSESEMLKMWFFKWKDGSKSDELKLKTVKRLCKELSKLSFVKYCEPDSLVKML